MMRVIFIFVTYFVVCSVATIHLDPLSINITKPGTLRQRKVVINSKDVEVQITLFAENWHYSRHSFILEFMICTGPEGPAFYAKGLKGNAQHYEKKLSFFDPTREDDVKWVYLYKIEQPLLYKPTCNTEWFCNMYMSNVTTDTVMMVYEINLEVELLGNDTYNYEKCNKAEPVFGFIFLTKTWMITSAVALVVVLIQSLVIWLLCKRIRKPRESFEEIPQDTSCRYLSDKSGPSAPEREVLYSVPYCDELARSKQRPPLPLPKSPLPNPRQLRPTYNNQT